jgi:hypothetical protein
MTGLRFTAALALIGFLLGAAPGDNKTPDAKKNQSEIGSPAPLAGFADAATFHLYANEERLASMVISWKADGTYDSRFVLSLAGQSIKGSLKITSGHDGTWKTIQVESPRGNSTTTREGAVAHRVSPSKNTTVKLKPNTVLFDNFSPTLICQAIRTYDQKKSGKQTIHALVLPGTMVDATLERLDPLDRNLGGERRKRSHPTRSTNITSTYGRPASRFPKPIACAWKSARPVSRPSRET